MKLVIFGLSVSSSWGNGHATLWRGLIRALARRKHRVVFFERDVPYYASHRDLTELPGGQLCLYSDWSEALPRASEQLADADVGIVTSFCPDGLAAAELLFDSNVRLRTFYDLDAPVTLDCIRRNQPVPYIGPRGLRDFDLVLSYTGGKALTELRQTLGAKWVEPLYGSVDPDVHFPVRSVPKYENDLSYLGTFSQDRQDILDELFVEPASRLPKSRFVIGGSQYPASFPPTRNIFHIPHVPPPEHPAFYCSSRITLNVTRRAMAQMGYCPSGRLFEAAACDVPILSDVWNGLDEFFEPGREILLARSAADTIRALDISDEELAAIARRARERTLDTYTAGERARELESILERVQVEPAGRDTCATA